MYTYEETNLLQYNRKKKLSFNPTTGSSNHPFKVRMSTRWKVYLETKFIMVVRRKSWETLLSRRSSSIFYPKLEISLKKRKKEKERIHKIEDPSMHICEYLVDKYINISVVPSKKSIKITTTHLFMN